MLVFLFCYVCVAQYVEHFYVLNQLEDSVFIILYVPLW